MLSTMDKLFYAAIYVRLSRDDCERENEQSESIKNQIDFLKRYLAEHGWTLVDVYCDDGYTGTSFNRPDFKRMLQDIEKKRINMVITKDLSRLGRDYIETGSYLERYFPEHGIRYIAVNDGIDTFESSSSNDMSPFKSVMNDFYARDISKKVRTVMNSKRKAGKFIGAFAPYGYMKDIQDKNRLVIDRQTSPIIRKIFQMYMDGYGFSSVAYRLNSEQIPTPTAYKAGTCSYKNSKSRAGLWTHETVSRILTNPTYAGNITQNRCVKVSYKSKKLQTVQKGAWITVDNTHEPIIDNETFELVQQIIRKKTNTEYSTEKKQHLLAGLVFCGDCGERLTFTRTSTGTGYVICSRYKRFKLCTRHSMLEAELEEQVLGDLRRIARFAVDKGRLLHLAKIRQNVYSKDLACTGINKIETRLAEIKRTIKTLYEDKLKGIIAENDFMELSQDYNREREQLNAKQETLKRQNNQLKQDGNEREEPFEFVEGFAELANVDKAALIKLIGRIEVFEDRKIIIHYKFNNPL